jgi:hypothetical protein
MKRRLFLAAILTLMFLSLDPGNAMSQKINPDTLNTEQLKIYKTNAYKMQTAGIILTIAGGVLTTSSLFFMFRTVSTEPIWDWNTRSANTYGILFLGGCASMGAGIPLWVVGSKRQAKAEIALKKMNVVPVNSGAIGVGLTVRF